MKLHLASARFEPFRWQESLTFSPAELGLDEAVELSPVEVEGVLSHVAPNDLVDAQASFRLTVPCGRCLKPVTEDVAATIRLVLVRRREGAAPEGERELNEDELGILEISGDSLDTRPLVAEQVVLSVPAKPLCREDCAGLCPSCGADLNAGPCGCEDEAVDPRWAGLAELKNKFEGGS